MAACARRVRCYPESDIKCDIWNVRFRPNADIAAEAALQVPALDWARGDYSRLPAHKKAPLRCLWFPPHANVSCLPYILGPASGMVIALEEICA